MNSKDCSHYMNHCSVYCECCDKFYPCRRCHNDEIYDHQLLSSDINKIKCDNCETVQDISNSCTNCNISFGTFNCLICRIFEDQTEKNIFHCDKCGICRVGGSNNFFHCDTCGCCLNIALKNDHTCFQNILNQECCICREQMFDGVITSSFMKCGHVLHTECLKEYIKTDYRCPLCHKSFIDSSNMTAYNTLLDQEILHTQIPVELDRDVNIDCYECHTKSIVKFHILGHKCSNCGSYNTTII